MDVKRRRAARYAVEGLVIAAILALVVVAGRWFLTGIPRTALDDMATPAVTPFPVFTPTPTWPHTPAASTSATPTFFPTPVPVTASPAPSATPTPYVLPTPPPIELIEQAEDTLNVVLLGADSSSDRYAGRTDVIVVASIDPALPSVSLLSIPRDFYAWIPEHGFNRINTAYRRGEVDGYEGGGPALLKATLEYNFGVPVHHYAMVDFDGFIEIVDALDGIDVAVECPLSDTFPDPDSPSGQVDLDWLPGIHHLDGKHALWYARSRWSTSDFDRNRRQQQVLRGMYARVATLDMLAQLPQVWPALDEAVSTDLELEDLVVLATIGSELDMMNVKSTFVGSDMVQQWTAPNGAWVLVPNYEALGPLVEEALAPPAAGRAAQPAFRVEVWNGTPEEGLGHVAAERLRWEGFEVVSVQRVEGIYARTQIWDLTTTSKGSPLPHLVYLYRRHAGDVVYQPTQERGVDFRIILGADYDPCLSAKSYWQPEPSPTLTPLPTVLSTPP